MALIGGNLQSKSEYSLALGKVRDKFLQNTEVKRLPEEKVDIKIISAVNNLTKARDAKTQGTVMDIQAIQEQSTGAQSSIQSSSVPISHPSKSKIIATINSNSTIQEELAEIVEILQEALLLAQQENNSLGDLKSPEFNEIRAVNLLTSGMVRNFSSSKISALIVEREKVKARIESIMLYCEGKNLKTGALNKVIDCTAQIVTLKAKQEFNVLGNENSKHEGEAKKVFAPKKSYGR